MFDSPVQTQNQNSSATSAATAIALTPGTAEAPRTFRANLLGLGSTAAIDCRASNISLEEVYVHVPLSAGLALGQRYEVQILDSTLAPEVANALAGCCYATVIQTNSLKSSAQQELGANLRFDHPLAI